MATVESPEFSKRRSFSPDKTYPKDMQQSEDPPAPADTERLVEQKMEAEVSVDSPGFAQNPSTAADSIAFTALPEDADHTTAEADRATDNLPSNRGEVTGEGAADHVSERALHSLDWSENEDCAEGLQRRGGHPSPTQDLSPVTESVGEGNCKTKVTGEMSETDISKVENVSEKESTEKGKPVEEKEKADGNDEEQVNPAAEQPTQPKKRRMVCKECGKIFNRRETFNLHRHFHLHEDDLKPLTCKECGLTFQQRSSFIKHRNEHKENGNKPLSVKKVVNKEEEQGAFKCAECATVFFSLTKLRNHRCSHSDDVPFHCPICRQDFMYKIAITRHMFTHSKERLQCAECDQTFSDHMSLRSHQHSHVFHKPYECPDCGMVFKQYSLMVDHRRKHTESSAPFPCNVCSKSFKYIGLLQQHQYLHTGKKPFLCTECGKTFAFAQNLKSHRRQHLLNITPADKPKISNSGHSSVKNSEKENMADNNDVVRTYNCPLCEKNYTTPANLRTHMHTHEAEYEMMEGTSRSKEPVKWDTTHSCPDCPNVYSDELSLKIHVSSAHKLYARRSKRAQIPPSMDEMQESLDRIRPFKCLECGKSFRHRSVLELHKRIHSKGKSYECKVCGKGFSTSRYLQKHLIVHTSKKPYKCPDCGKDFAFLHSMKTHHKLHQEKPFRCTYCRKGYSEEAQLQHHMLSHNGEKPHKCNICDKRFGLAYLLRDHMNTHTGDRPHRCEKCNKSFTWLSSLMVHQKNAHKRRNTNHFNSFPLGDRVSDSSSDLKGGALGLSRPDMVGLPVSSDTPAGEAELDHISDQTPPVNAGGKDLKQQNKPVLSELLPPVQWKVDGGEVMPVPSIQKTLIASQPFDKPSLSRSLPGKTKEASHMMESSFSYISTVSTIVPKKSSPSSAPEIDQQRQLLSVPWSSPSSAVVSTSSLPAEFSHSGYIDGAALWSVRPTTPNTSLHGTPKKPGQEVQFPTWQDSPMPPQTDLSTPSKNEERCTWDISNAHVQTVKPEKSWAPGLQSATSLVQIAPHGIGTRWDIQTTPGLQQTLNSPDRLVTNPDFHLQQKQVSPSWAGVQSQTTAPNVPISIQYDPHRFSQAIGARLWGFQTSPVGPQAILKPGTVQELQHQQPIATGTKIILNQPPPFFPLPPIALPASHPLHSVPVAALPRPPHPNIFFPPQAVTQTLTLPQLPAQRETPKLGPRLSFPPDRLHQCMICGCSLPREMDLQLHYMQHAQGKI